MRVTPDLIVFDCDGVLIDSERLAFQAFTQALTTLGVTLDAEEAMRRYTGLSEASEIADLEKRYSIKLTPEYFAQKDAIRVGLFESHLKAMSGIFDLLDALAWKKCVASSSAPERLRHSLGLTGLWDRFAPNIFSATQVDNGKPAPDLFVFAAEKMHAPRSSCIVIEDSVYGVKAARAAGMRSFGFVGGSHCDTHQGERLKAEGAEQIFKSMSDLADYLFVSETL